MNKVEKKLLDYQHDLKIKELEKERDCKLEAMKYARETHKLNHLWEMERMRIKNAEIRKNLIRKLDYGRTETNRG